jgi:hypothetical protein
MAGVHTFITYPRSVAVRLAGVLAQRGSKSGDCGLPDTPQASGLAGAAHQNAGKPDCYAGMQTLQTAIAIKADN